MERLLYFLPAPHQPIYFRYGITAIVMLCSIAVFIALEMQSGFVGLFALLPGIFLAGIMFDRGSGFFATFMGAFAGLWPLWGDGFRAATLPLMLFVLIGIAF